MISSNIWDEFFEQYNLALADRYRHLMEKMPEDYPYTDREAQSTLRHLVLNSMQEWYSQPRKEWQNRTPESFIDELNEADDIVEVVKMAFIRCDDDIPDFLKIRLSSLGERAVHALSELVLGADWKSDYTQEDEPSEALQHSSGALKLLGEWGISRGQEAFVEKFCLTKTPHEFIADAMKEYLVRLGEPAGMHIIAILNSICESREGFSTAAEYLLISLTLIEKTDGADSGFQDTAFNCLRDCFRTMDHRVIGAICLGDCGDPRGIRVLKGYLDRNIERVDRQLFYEILSSIKRLGGNTLDIKDPFRDFSSASKA